MKNSMLWGEKALIQKGIMILFPRYEFEFEVKVNPSVKWAFTTWWLNNHIGQHIPSRFLSHICGVLRRPFLNILVNQQPGF